jgi:uncharacterized protein with HEPN domain
MPSDRARAALIDILGNIELAESFAQHLTLEQFKSDIQRIYATTRALEIISEASRRLPDDLKARYPAVPWQQIAGAGNVYRHGYDAVAAEILWQTVQTGLVTLREAVKVELGPSG